jgi:hypothetical protein
MHLITLPTADRRRQSHDRSNPASGSTEMDLRGQHYTSRVTVSERERQGEAKRIPYHATECTALCRDQLTCRQRRRNVTAIRLDR